MKYRIQQFIDGRWQRTLLSTLTHDAQGNPVTGIPTEQQFDHAEAAQAALDELRQHPEWTMAQLRVASLGE